MKLHLDGIGRDKLRALIKIGFSHPVLNQMNAAGYEGVYTQTGNKGIRILFLREKQGIEIKTSFVTTVKTSLTGLYGTIFYGYPKSGMPKRIVFTFKETGNSAQRAKEDKAMPPNAFKGKEVFETDRAMTGLEEYPTADEVAYHVARRMADVLKANNSKGRTTRMIVPTGGTYEAVYKKFLEIIADEQINCAGLITFNMDEYYQVDDAHSFREYMENHLFRHLRHLNLGWKDNNAHMLDGSTKDIDAEVKAYEQAIKDGGIDLALGGIGRDGHIAFNEPIIRVGRQGITLQQARDFNEFVLVDVPIDEQEGIIRNVRSQRAQAHTGPAFEEYLKFNLKSQDVAGLAARLYTQPIAIYKNLEDLPKSRTRLVQLALPSIIDNSRYFKDINQMPIEALTIGIETLNDAKAIIIAATGANKADAVAEVSATLLTGHDNLTWVVDQEAAMTKPGGIDLNPTKMDLETQNAGEAINLHMDPAKLKQLQNAPGFTPVIINIVPLIDVKTFLGIVS